MISGSIVVRTTEKRMLAVEVVSGEYTFCAMKKCKSLSLDKIKENR